MEKLNNPAILVVDMLNDFVTGALTCDRAKAIVPATAELLDAARKAGVPVIFCNDAHIAGIDRELKIWGDHAIAGHQGCRGDPRTQTLGQRTTSYPSAVTADSSRPTSTSCCASSAYRRS